VSLGARLLDVGASISAAAAAAAAASAEFAL